jgi:hypothetical protein
MKPENTITLESATVLEIFAELERRGWQQVIEPHAGPYQEIPITFEVYPENETAN